MEWSIFWKSNIISFTSKNILSNTKIISDIILGKKYILVIVEFVCF